MKHTFLCYLSPSLFHLWRVKAVGRMMRIYLPITGIRRNQKDDETQEPVVCSITPMGELNQGTSIINSHADVTKRSSLMMNYRTLVTMEDSYPRYPRIKK